MAKKKESQGSKKKKTKARSKLKVLSSGAGKSKEPKENPFENIWSHRKFNILGKKRKNDERRRIGLSRSLGIQKRQKTLLKEYEQNKKSSVFLDKRIGENNEGLQEFDKAIMRSQREMQSKLKKKSKFNLSDGEEDDFEIEGGFFPERDDYDDDEPLDEEDAGRSVSERFNRSQLNPGEAEDSIASPSNGQEIRHTSKKEVMEDIILKSKFFKAQKAKDKEENERLMGELDKKFMSLVQSDAMRTLVQPNKAEVTISSQFSNGVAANGNLSNADFRASKEQEKYDHYESLVSEMALDIRARPSDRTKSAEELALEEKERLEELEEKRQKRMATTEDSDDEGSDTGYEKDDGSRVRPISGDDDPGILVSDNSLSRTKVGCIEGILTRETHKDAAKNDTSSEQSESGGDDVDSEDEEEEDDDEDENDEVGDVPSVKDWEQSDDEYGEDEFNEEEEAAVEQKNECQVPHRVKANSGQLQSELPFTIEAPKSFEEFSALLENRSNDQIIEAIKRIRAFNAISIAAENRKKMQVFYGILLQYFAVLASKKPSNFLLLDMLVKPLMEMSAEVPYFAAICVRQRLLKTRLKLCENLKSSAESCWPNLKTICLMRLWCMIFPCSDFRHPVMTPLLFLISEYLMRCPISSGRDIAVGSFLCSLMLNVIRQSKRFFPEALIFIQSMLVTALNNKQVIKSSKLYHLMELKTFGPVLRLQRRGADETHPFDFFTLMDLPDDSPYFTSDDFKVSMVFILVRNVIGYVEVYHSLKSFPEIFSPVSKTLRQLVNEDLLPEKLRAVIEEASRLIEDKCGDTHMARQRLRYQKVKILKTFAPKFEESFVKGRDYDPDRDRAERKKLKKRLKQEAKGAARELRKDNQFLLEVKERERAEREEEKAERFGKFKAFLQEQEHAFRSGRLGKGNKRKR